MKQSLILAVLLCMACEEQPETSKEWALAECANGEYSYERAAGVSNAYFSCIHAYFRTPITDAEAARCESMVLQMFCPSRATTTPTIDYRAKFEESETTTRRCRATIDEIVKCPGYTELERTCFNSESAVTPPAEKGE